ncbi:MAG: SWIM zinc finger family protein [Rubrobacteraceae bacterium]|nr:SWIM zinc finger family protein [Rubrobacteraceae bacterium]
MRKEEGVQVPSFSEPDLTYSVNLESWTCDCPAFRYRGGECKHLRLARSGVDLSGACRGVLADGRRVLVLDSVVHDYEPQTLAQRFQRKIWGWSWGEWQHALCFDGRSFWRESTRIGTGETRLEQVDPSRWTCDLPAYCMREAA